MDLKGCRRDLFTLIDQLADAGDLQAIGQLRETLSDAIDRLRVKATQQFHVGDHLRWAHNGEKYSGIVEKVNPKTLQLKVTEPVAEKGKRWKVSPGFITGRAASEPAQPVPDNGAERGNATVEALDAATRQASIEAGATHTSDRLVRALRDLIPVTSTRGEDLSADAVPSWEELVALCACNRDMLAAKLEQLGDPGLANLASIVRDHRSPEFVLSSWLEVSRHYRDGELLLCAYHEQVGSISENDHVQEVEMLRESGSCRLYLVETAAHGYFFVVDAQARRAVCVGEEDEGITSAQWCRFFACDRYGHAAK